MAPGRRDVHHGQGLVFRRMSGRTSSSREAMAFPEGLLERAADGHVLAHTLHVGGQRASLGELLEGHRRVLTTT